MTPPEEKEYSSREVAGLITAIGWLRNELIWIITPKAEIDAERITRLLDSTSIAQIEETLALPKDSLSLDHKKFITAREEHLIAAKDITYFDDQKHKPA